VDERTEVRSGPLAMALDEAGAMHDLRASVTWLLDRGATSVGAIGFCTHHAFFNDTRRAHDPEAAALAWDRTLAFLREHLR
jgi:dienelactone hydrolase